MDGAGELMLRFRAGDAEAFAALYAEYKGPLFRYLKRRLNRQDQAEEIFQDTWQRVIEARHRYEPQAPFGAWLFRIAHNRLADHYRARSRAAAWLTGSDAAPDPALDPAQQPEALVSDAQTADTLLACLASLPEEQREAFLLREEAGLNLAQIAEVTGVNPETAKSRLRYAVRKLRKALAGGMQTA